MILSFSAVTNQHSPPFIYDEHATFDSHVLFLYTDVLGIAERLVLAAPSIVMCFGNY